MFLICHMTFHECVFNVMWIYEWKPPTESHHLAMPDSCWSSASGYIKYLIYHVTSQNCIQNQGSSLWVGALHGMPPPPKVWCSGIRVGEMLLVFHVIKQDHVIKGSSDYNDISPTLPNLVVTGTVVVEIRVLVLHVIWHDHMIKGSSNFMGGSQLR